MKPRQKKPRRANRSAKTEQGGSAKYAVALLKAVVLGLLVTTALLLLFSLVMSRRDIPFSLINPLGVGALIAGAMAAGLTAARLLREHGMGVGALSGLLLYLTLLLGSAMIAPSFGVTALIKLVIALVSGAIGGIMGVNMRRRRK